MFGQLYLFTQPTNIKVSTMFQELVFQFWECSSEETASALMVHMFLVGEERQQTMLRMDKSYERLHRKEQVWTGWSGMSLRSNFCTEKYHRQDRVIQSILKKYTLPINNQIVLYLSFLEQTSQLCHSNG